MFLGIPGKSLKEGQEDQGTLKVPGGTPGSYLGTVAFLLAFLLASRELLAFFLALASAPWLSVKPPCLEAYRAGAAHLPDKEPNCSSPKPQLWPW